MAIAQRAFGLPAASNVNMKNGMLFQPLPNPQQPFAKKGFKDTPFVLEPEDSIAIAFTDERLADGLEKKMDLLWDKSTSFLWRGYLSRPQQVVPSAPLRVKRATPFLFDKVQVRIIHPNKIRPEVQRAIQGSVIAGGEKQGIYVWMLEPGETILEHSFNQATTEVELELFDPFKPQDAEKDEEAEMEVSFVFFYNGRAFLDVAQRTSLTILGNSDGLVGVQVALNPEYNNTLYSASEQANFAWDMEKQAYVVDLRSNAAKDILLWEYFLSDGDNLPVSPSFHWVEKKGSQEIVPDFLQDKEYQLHYRGYYGNGRWSAWKKTASVYCPKKALLKDAKDSIILFSKWKVFPTRTGGLYVHPSQVPFGGEFSVSPGENEFLRVPYKSVLKDNKLSLKDIPAWANYYRFVDEKGMPLGPLYTIPGRERAGILTPKAFQVKWPFEFIRFTPEGEERTSEVEQWIESYKKTYDLE